MIRNKNQFVKILSISFIVFIGILLISLCANLIQSLTLATRRRNLTAELERLEQTISKNQTEIEYKQSSDYADRYAREHLDKSNPDEEVYVGIDGE